MSAAIAVALAEEHGCAVFPCGIDKRPTTPHGFRDATRDRATILELWRRYPGPLIGIATGEPSGVDALDLDRQHGASSWWQEHRDNIPKTRTHRTRSGGLHILFRNHPGLRCSTSRIALGVDVRADGGCIVWWPSIGLPVLADLPIAEWPAWLLEAAMPLPRPVWPRPSAISLHGDRAERYAQAVLQNAADRVAMAHAGRRNAVLNREAFSLVRRFSDALGMERIAEVLAAAALAAGLSLPEVRATLTSALRAGGQS